VTREEILSAAYSIGTPGEPWWLDDDDLIEFATEILAMNRDCPCETDLRLTDLILAIIVVMVVIAAVSLIF